MLIILLNFIPNVETCRLMPLDFISVGGGVRTLNLASLVPLAAFSLVNQVGT